VKNEDVVQPRGKRTPYIQCNTVFSHTHTQNTKNFLPEYSRSLQPLQMTNRPPTKPLPKHTARNWPYSDTGGRYRYLL